MYEKIHNFIGVQPVPYLDLSTVTSQQDWYFSKPSKRYQETPMANSLHKSARAPLEAHIDISHPKVDAHAIKSHQPYKQDYNGPKSKFQSINLLSRNSLINYHLCQPELEMHINSSLACTANFSVAATNRFASSASSPTWLLSMNMTSRIP